MAHPLEGGLLLFHSYNNPSHKRTIKSVPNGAPLRKELVTLRDLGYIRGRFKGVMGNPLVDLFEINLYGFLKNPPRPCEREGRQIVVADVAQHLSAGKGNISQGTQSKLTSAVAHLKHKSANALARSHGAGPNRATNKY